MNTTQPTLNEARKAFVNALELIAKDFDFSEPKREHPSQPIAPDEKGNERFVSNAIVKFLLERGAFTINDLEELPFSRKDWVQFAQLIGYSLNGFTTLPYVEPSDISAALAPNNTKPTGVEIKLKHAEIKLKNIKSSMRDAVSAIYDIHPDDLR